MTMRNYKLQVTKLGLSTHNTKNTGISSLVPVGVVSRNALNVGACSRSVLSTRIAVDLALNYLIRRQPISININQLLTRLFGDRAAGVPLGRRARLQRGITTSHGKAVNRRCHLGWGGVARRRLRTDRRRLGADKNVAHAQRPRSVVNLSDEPAQSCHFCIDGLRTANVWAPFTWHHQSDWSRGGEQ